MHLKLIKAAMPFYLLGNVKFTVLFTVAFNVFWSDMSMPGSMLNQRSLIEKDAFIIIRFL